MNATERHRQMMRELKAIREACDKIAKALGSLANNSKPRDKSITVRIDPQRFRSYGGVPLSDDFEVGKIE